jgi:ABC-type uncharacterized transport system permease subunit|tara:strand:+ start:330 stop:698 length:369 start_codon:yes stop_codon:yes gene_type:complete
MEELLGTTWSVFIRVTLVIMGFAAFMTGRALADAWRPLWQAVMYAMMLGIVDRFLVFALFEGEGLSATGYLIDTAVLLAIGLTSFRLTRTHRMVSQYPWIYERAGLFNWREKDSAGSENETG